MEYKNHSTVHIIISSTQLNFHLFSQKLKRANPCNNLLPRAHAQGVKQSSVVVVVVVVGTKIARSHVLDIYACCKHNQSVDIGAKLVCTRFELLKKA